MGTDRKLLTANRALVRLAVIHADHSRAARWALPLVLTHAQHRSQQRRHDAQHNHRYAKENAPSQQTEQDSWDDQDRGGDEAVVQAAESAARRMMLVLARVYCMHNRRSTMRAEGSRHRKMSSAF